jgi:hypothetical protein
MKETSPRLCSKCWLKCNIIDRGEGGVAEPCSKCWLKCGTIIDQVEGGITEPCSKCWCWLKCTIIDQVEGGVTEPCSKCWLNCGSTIIDQVEGGIAEPYSKFEWCVMCSCAKKLMRFDALAASEKDCVRNVGFSLADAELIYYFLIHINVIYLESQLLGIRFSLRLWRQKKKPCRHLWRTVHSSLKNCWSQLQLRIPILWPENCFNRYYDFYTIPTLCKK